MINRVTLITGSEGKAREFAAMLGIDVVAVKAELAEVQALDVADVVTRKVEEAYARVNGPVLVDDTGLALHAWNGLPGALVRWFLDTVGTAGLLDMASNVTERAATVTTALGFMDGNGVQVFTGSVSGRLATRARGTNGFGYDSIFIPDGSDLTFAEMSPEQKNRVSHRRLAVDAMRAAIAFPDARASSTPSSAAEAG